MDIKEEITLFKKRKNAILINKDSPYLSDLKERIEKTDHKRLIVWGLLLAKESIIIFSRRHPDESIPYLAYKKAKLWSQGKIKMREAQKAILACHAIAKNLDDKADIALVHAIGQALSIVHTVKHALGYPLYDLTFLIVSNDESDIKAILDERMEHYVELLDAVTVPDGPWASFIA